MNNSLTLGSLFDGSGRFPACRIDGANYSCAVIRNIINGIANFAEH